VLALQHFDDTKPNFIKANTLTSVIKVCDLLEKPGLKVLANLTEHTKRIRDLCVDYHKELLFSGGEDEFVMVYRLDIMQRKKKVPVNAKIGSFISKIDVLNDSTMFACCYSDGFVEIYDYSKEKCLLKRFEPPIAIYNLKDTLGTITFL